MWWVRSKLVEAYLGTTVVGVRANGAETWGEVSGAETAVSHLIGMLKCSAGPKMRVRVWLSAALSRAFLVPPQSGAKNDEEALAIAQALAAEATGTSGELTVWADFWNAQRGCLGAAVPTETLTALREGCPANGLRLLSVKPWWNLAINQALDERAGGSEVLWSLSEPDAMTLGTLKASAVESIDTLEPTPHDPGWAHARARARTGHGSGLALWHADADLRPQVSHGLPIGSWRLTTATGDTPVRVGDERAVEAKPA